MSNNNDSGGGCLLWFINWIFNIFRNKRIRKYNRQARGVEEYSSATAGTLFPPNTYRDNIIISGGGQGDRLRLCEQVIRNAHNANHPVIIIHTVNGALENIIAGNNLGTVVNGNNKQFDAFTSFEFNEIVQIVADTGKSKYDIKPAGRYVLQVVYELLSSQGRKPYFSNFANCPYFKLNDQIASRLSGGAITQDTADRLNSFLLTGQAECPKIDTFFSDLKSQIEFISAKDPKSVGAVSVLTAIKKKRTLCVDIKSSSNTMLLELIVNSLVIAMNRGYDFSLLIDDVAFTNNELLKNAVCQKSNHRNIILSKDLYSLTGGKEDTFSTIVGEAEKTVLFAHSSSTSCEKWSKYLGEYEKIDVQYNQNAGWNQSSKWGYTQNTGQTETLKREHKVKPEQIRSLSPNEAFVYDNAADSLIKARIE